MEPKARPDRSNKPFEPFEHKYIRKNFLKYDYRTIARHLGRSKYGIQNQCIKMGLKLPEEIRKARNNFFGKGHIPANKGKRQKEYMSGVSISKTIATRFKKGRTNHNELYDGAIRTRSERIDKKGRYRPPHKYIRISKGVWKELQIYNWEKKNGQKAKGFILACKDGNTLNCRPSNWTLMTKAQNALRNSGSLNLKDGYLAKAIVGKYRDPELYELVKNSPDLIAIKRQQLLLKRAINAAATNTKKA